MIENWYILMFIINNRQKKTTKVKRVHSEFNQSGNSLITNACSIELICKEKQVKSEIFSVEQEAIIAA